jgi:hypothetical protein
MTADGAFTQHPSDVLIDLVADLLAPMFIAAAGGDYRYARLAAMETVWSYKAATQADLLQVIQIVAYGLAAVRTLCVSMTEEVSVPTLLRLNLSAERLSRAESRARKARLEDRCRQNVSKTDKKTAPPRPRPTETPVATATEPDPTPTPSVKRPIRTGNDTVVQLPPVRPDAPFMEIILDKSLASSAAAEPNAASADPSRHIIDAVRFQLACQSVEIRRYGSMRSWALGTVSRDALNAEPVPAWSVRAPQLR